MTNIIARLAPSNPRRIIVATHYDSIVRAYRDDKKPDAPMPGANNSASGVAVLLETARVLGTLPPPPVGIDMIFFDGEEGPKSLGAGDPNWLALGSPYFTAHLGDFYSTRKPESAVVFDMVCYRNLQLNPELSSLFYAQERNRRSFGVSAPLSRRPSSCRCRRLIRSATITRRLLWPGFRASSSSISSMSRGSTPRRTRSTNARRRASPMSDERCCDTCTHAELTSILRRYRAILLRRLCCAKLLRLKADLPQYSNISSSGEGQRIASM